MQWNRENEFKVVNQGDDKEVTLGPMVLTAIGVGIFALCCVCFLAGYVVGRHSGTPKPASPTASASTGRSAAEILAEAQPARPAADVTAPSRRSPPEETPARLTRAASDPDDPPTDPPEVPEKAAPVSQHSGPQPVATQPAVHTALAQSTAQVASWLVQVAAVENSTDADVLVSALRRRGYSVSARHEPGDNLLHVQVGPFASRSDADAMRQRLLNDGYNAMVEP
jgi:DedD protein